MATRRRFIRTLAAAPAILLHGLRARAATARTPNVVFVFADQMRASAVGCMGNNQVRTPNMDRLAAQGTLFTNAHSATPVCTPYRATLLTGRYAHSTNMMQNDVHLAENLPTVAEAFKARGYRTGYIGKWHLHGGPRNPGFIPPGPARQGFDFWAANECTHAYFRSYYFRDTPRRIPIQGYEPDGMTDLALDFIRANRDGPFCLLLSWGPPHNPYIAPPEYMRVYRREDIRQRPNVPPDLRGLAARDNRQIAGYYAATTNLDHNLGRIMAALDTLRIAEDTILVFASDHGDMLGSQGQFRKCRPWAESAHVPFILRYPRHGRPGHRTDVLLNSVDIMPTLLSLANVPTPAGVQGTDLSFAALGREGREPASLYLSFYCTWQGMQPWRAVVTKDWKYARHQGGPWLLYDRRRDPYELRNLATDPALAAERQRLDRTLADWMTRTADDWQRFRFPDLHPGRRRRPRPRAGKRP